MRSALNALASASPLSLTRETAPDGLLDGERARNRLLASLRENGAIRDLLLDAASRDHAPGQALYLLLPQSSTLDDVRVTMELVESHLVLLQRGVPRGQPRAFTSLNGLYGTCQADGSITVHGRRRAADTDSALGGSIGVWEVDGLGRRGATVPQLESQIVILRESQLQASARLPLRMPVGLLLVSDPLFFPGCGWKLPLALRRCTHRFRDVDFENLPLSELPQLLYEYQVMARAWLEEDKEEETTALAAERASGAAADDARITPSSLVTLTSDAIKGADAVLREPPPPTGASPSAASLLRSLLGGAASPEGFMTPSYMTPSYMTPNESPARVDGDDLSTPPRPPAPSEEARVSRSPLGVSSASESLLD